jgi:hypothetical protein
MRLFSLLSYGFRHLNFRRIPHFGHKKFIAGFSAFAHQVMERAVGVEFIEEFDFEEATSGAAEGGLFELLGKHFSQPFEAADDGLGIGAGFGDDAIFFFIGSGPLNFLANFNAIQGWLGDINMSLANEIVGSDLRKCRNVFAQLRYRPLSLLLGGIDLSNMPTKRGRIQSPVPANHHLLAPSCYL